MVISSFSLFFISYLNFQQQAQNVLILTIDTLAFNRSQRTASGHRWCWWALHIMYNRPQQRSSPRWFISKIRREIKSEKWCLKAIIYTRSTFYVECLYLMFSLDFLHFPNSNSIWNARTFLNEFLWTPWCSVGKKITFFFTRHMPQPYLMVPLIFLLHWQIFPNFALRGRIGKNSNFDHIFG